MQLTEDHNNAIFQINALLSDGIVINHKKYVNSLVLAPDVVLENWGPTSPETLTEAHISKLLDFKPEIILIGTGKKSLILPNKTLEILLKNQFHAECMNTSAACRTYTILSAENRRVVAGLIL